MIFSTPKLMLTAVMMTCFCVITTAQKAKLDFQGSTKKKNINQRIDDYLDLLNQGYSEVEIFQDLGNVNLLTENYEEAAFWYEKFLKANQNRALQIAYTERYQYAKEKMRKGPSTSPSKDWLMEISADYENQQLAEIHQSNNNIELTQSTYHPIKGKSTTNRTPTLSVTADGQVAYFSQPVSKKPLTGIFSKKETVHEIYRAENVRGEWGNIKKVAVCPERYSAKHPTVSGDGTRLFFASNMPGTYGKYDIYVANIKKDGSMGTAKNLGPKVNTKKDDMHPSLVNGTLLFYASNGRQGFGGLDLYAVQVAGNRLSKSVNLGSPINSQSDDFSLVLMPERGMGYVMSNRGANNALMKVAVSYKKKKDGAQLAEKNDDVLMKVLNDQSRTDFSSTVFEND